MTKFTCAVASFILVAAGTFAVASDVIEVRLLEGAREATPSTQPAGPLGDAPRDARVLLSIEALADNAGDVETTCLVDGQTIHLKGHITTLADGKRRLKLDFSHRFPAGVHSLTTNVELAMNDSKVVGGLYGGTGATLIVATIKPNAQAAGGKAE